MSETGDSDEGFENVNHGRGRKRKIIMKIEVDDSDEVNTDSGNDSTDSDSNGTRKKQTKCRRNRIVSNENGNEVLTGEKAASSGINGTAVDSTSDSSSDETLEKCPICLLTFRNQEVASPSTCDHTFCFICLEEWSKNVSTCPIDRLEFKIIAVRKSYSSLKTIRKVAVEGGNVLTEHGNDEDVTNCEICHRPDREDVMLLCDGCNQGYHMYCLTPPLEIVPEGSWYCDHCFESDEEDVEDLNLVYQDLREMGVSESRLRITEVRQPRVPRTRQTERVRARVFARTSGRRMASENGRAMSASTNRTGCRKKAKKRRSTRRRRTCVVEYDINNYDEKFAIKTTKRYIRKRRSRKRVKASKRVNNSRNTVEKLFKAAQRSAVPTTSFSIFGSRNALEYFSDYEDDFETYSTPSCTSVQTSVRIRNFGSVIRRKNVLAAMEAPGNQNDRVDVLSSIMDMQDRWHNVSQNNSSNTVHIGSDGRLTFKENLNKSTTKSNESREKLRDAINQAPLYPRGNNPNFSGGGDRYNYSNNYRNNAGFRNSGGGQYRHSTGIGFGMSPFRRDDGTGQFNRNFQSNIQISPILPDRLRNPQNNRQDRRNANRTTTNENVQATGENSQTTAGHLESAAGACPESQPSMSRDNKSDNYNTVESATPASNLSSIVPPLAPPPWNKNLFRLAGDYDDDDDDDGGDCPNFSIYSAESLQVARSEPEVSKSPDKGQEDEYEDREEDLVQLGDDDEIPAAIESGNRSRNDSTNIYEPEYPTDEIDEESQNKDENIFKSGDDNKLSEDADIPSGSINDKGSKDIELTNSNIDEFVDKKSGLLDILGESDSEELIDKNTDIHEPSGDDDASDDMNDDLSKDLSDEVPIMECENDQQNMQTESISEEEDRSYTPCLDEKIDQDDSTDIQIESHTPPKPPERETADSDRGEVSAAGIDGMETELISDEDEEILTQDQCVSSSKKKEKDKEENAGKKPRKETFKKISKSTKERNYRGDKERERVKRKSSRSRSQSNDKENENSRKSDRKRIKRKELERYDVRNVIGQPRTYKDRYGRDTSRPPKSRSHTRSRSRRNRTRSRSKLRSRSVSSKKNRRSFSISPSPVSYAKSSSLRRSLSSRRSRSKRSRSRRRTPMRRRTRTPLRVRSPSPKPNSRKKKFRQRSLSLSSRSEFRSRSRDFEPRKERSKSLNRTKNKRRKSKDHKKKKVKKHSPSLSLSPEKRSVKPVEHKEPTTRKKKRRSKSKTPEQNVWQSNSPQVPIVENDHSWTPPLVSSNPANLTVILKNKDDGKKKEKKKKKDKRREVSGKRERRKTRTEVRESPLAPSKEVFASGDNILVSVSFNKDTSVAHPPPQQTTVVTLPPTREEIVSKRRSAEKVPKKQKKIKDKAQRKHRKVDSKPVAFIDLERSPFQVIVQSPKDVIILTDSDQELENNREFSNRSLNEEVDSMEPTNVNTQLDNVEPCTPIERTEISQEQSFDSSVQQLGPKTPPEPPLIKFSLNPKTKQIKTRNPLHEEQDESDHEQPEENVEEVEKSNANIIGPNTPPESGPCSPDAYDPFDPTKSPSASPSVPPADEISTPVENDSSPTEDVREPRPQVLATQEKGMNPVDLVMALMNSKTPKSHEICSMNNEQQYAMSSNTDGSDTHEKPEDGNIPKSITVLSNVLITSGKTQSRSTIPTIASPVSKAPPAIGMPQQNIVSKLPLPRTSSNSRQNNGGGTGGIDETVNEIESPYSPGSDDYDDLFEPPPENAASLQHSQRNRGQGKSKSSNKTELFDNLFGNASPVKIPSYTPSTVRKRGIKSHKKTSVKVAKMPGSGKMDEDQIKILDDLPSSAVELQVKDKFLRKLNRQERVVEEVKLVLKPHYTKKHITKDDYKEILRRAVPKICHSRSQEINPKKIQNLIEAYVKKFRQRNKFGILNTGQVSSAVKCAAYLKKL